MQRETDVPFRRLSPRHRDCLRLIYDRKRTKEIASLLGLSVGTVATYCTEAIRILGARDRFAAAELFHEYERSPRKRDEAADGPEELGAQSEGVGLRESKTARQRHGSDASRWRRLLPIRAEGSTRNDLGFLTRVLWVPLLALVFAIGFGVLADTLRLASELLHRGGR